MHFLIIFPAVLLGFAAARPHPQGGSAGVLGFCHTGVPGCAFSSLYDCTNRGGHTQYYCVNKCGCENKRSVKNAPPLTEPSPAPLPLVKSNGKDESSPETVSSNEPETSPETSTEAAAPEESTPEMTTEQPAPEESTPETTTEQPAPEESTPETTSEQPAPEEAPEESAPEESAPEESAPEEAPEKS